MTQKKKNNIIIGSLCAVVLLMAVGYAAFSSILNIKGTTNISSNWKVLITKVASKNIVGSASNAEEPSWEDLTATFKTNLVSPGDSIEYDITVSNKGNLNAVLEKITLSDSNNPAIKFTSSGLEEGSELNAGDSKVLTVKVEYDSAVTSQPENTEGTFTVTLDYSQKEGSGVVSQTAAEKLIATATDSGDGLYADEYEAGRYVYRGANPANYITFNNESWRIISVENDGSLKIMKKDSIGNMAFDSYVGSAQHWKRPATINTYLNDDYYANLLDKSKVLIAEHNFNVGTVQDGNTDLSAQIASEKSATWTGKLGLLNASDFIKANLNSTQCGNFQLHYQNSEICKSTNYLVLDHSAWTINQYMDNDYRVIVIYNQLSNNEVDSKIGIHPVLYLTPNITLDGEGTSSNPYTIN